MPAPDVVYHFDPLCPWTWMTSRWLTEVAGARSLTVGFGALSLRLVNGIAAGQHAPLDVSFAALRVVEALAESGDHDAAGRFYGALGDAVHRRQQTLDADLVTASLAAAQVPEPAAAAFADAAWDERVDAATRAAVDAAGGGVGSPVISWPATGQALSGPIVSPAPTGSAAERLWDTVTAVLDQPDFYELKRGRTGVKPQVR
jgi:hypothetical protein